MVVVLDVSGAVSVRDEEELGVGVESDVGHEVVADGADVFREGFRLWFGESGASGVGFVAGVAAGATVYVVISRLVKLRFFFPERKYLLIQW